MPLEIKGGGFRNIRQGEGRFAVVGTNERGHEVVHATYDDRAQADAAREKAGKSLDFVYVLDRERFVSVREGDCNASS